MKTVAAILLMSLASHAARSADAATITLTDGRRIEGDIVKKLGGLLFIQQAIGGAVTSGAGHIKNVKFSMPGDKVIEGSLTDWEEGAYNVHQEKSGSQLYIEADESGQYLIQKVMTAQKPSSSAPPPAAPPPQATTPPPSPTQAIIPTKKRAVPPVAPRPIM